MYDDIKIAFFDFDRTLFTHSYPVAGYEHPNFEEECYNQLTRQAEIVAGDKPVKAMQWLIKYLDAIGCTTYVLSHEIFSLRDDYKKNAADRYYGIRKYITVCRPEHKIAMIKAVARAHDVRLDQCLFVDDKIDIVYEACNTGIAGVHTSNVCQQYEEALCMNPGCSEGCDYPLCAFELDGHCPYTVHEEEPSGWVEGSMNPPIQEVQDGK